MPPFGIASAAFTDREFDLSLLPGEYYVNLSAMQLYDDLGQPLPLGENRYDVEIITFDDLINSVVETTPVGNSMTAHANSVMN